LIDNLKTNKKLWDLFTKREEYNPSVLDKYQRFPYYLSKYKNVFQPEVSKHLIKKGLEIEYPKNKKFAVCLTHDIDHVYFSKLKLGYEAVKSLQKFKIGKALKTLLCRSYRKFNPLWNFSDFINVEKKYNAKSSFYFLVQDRHDSDFNYKITDLKTDLRNIIDEGWEIGLHGRHESYNNLVNIKKEKEKLEEVIEKKVIGYRNHYLRFKVPITWKLLKEAGFQYDTTFGYSDCAGFRNGMCHPFKPFDLNANDYIDILEIPLVIMDTTLFGYMQLDIKNAWGTIKQLIDTVEKNKGVVTILWHNESLIGEMADLYEEILEYCHQKQAWMTSGEEIWGWWNNNNFFKGHFK